MYFYEILQSIMKEKNLSIPAVARLSGLPDSTVRSILTRKNKTVALEVAFKLAKGLGVSLEELNGEQGMASRDVFPAEQRTAGKNKCAVETSETISTGKLTLRTKLVQEVKELDEWKLRAVAAFLKYLGEAEKR